MYELHLKHKNKWIKWTDYLDLSAAEHAANVRVADYRRPKGWTWRVVHNGQMLYRV